MGVKRIAPLLALSGCMAVLMDGFTTWAALAGPLPVHEQSTMVATMIATLGLLPGVAASVGVRLVVFLGLAEAMQRIPGRLSWVPCGLAVWAAGATMYAALHNICVLAHV